MKIRVAINGYGTIGKRVADAVQKQKDMQIIGVTKTKPDFEARIAIEKGYKLYAAVPEKLADLKATGLPVEGTIEDLLEECDIVVDCAPGKVGKENREKYYTPKNKKAIFQGGEKSGIGTSFNAICNYEKAFNQQFVRVVSCNTTGLCRSLHTVETVSQIEKVRAVMIRRGADPNDKKRGPINAIVPDPPTVPSHHGPDVQTVLPHVPITTMAVIVPTTLAHLHTVMVEIKQTATTEQFLTAFEKAPRIQLLSAKEGIESTAEAMEYARDIGRPRGDLNEIGVWTESVNCTGKEVFYMQMIHQESDVVPENVDCIRAMLGLERDKMKSIRATDESLGLKKWW